MEKSRLQFSNPVLTKLEFQLNPEFQENEDGEVSLETKFNTKISIPEKSQSSAAVALEITIEAEEKNNSPFIIDAEMISQFVWERDSLTETSLNELLRQNAPALLLGYLRPIIASMTMLANLPPYHIPFMDFSGEVNSESS